MKEAKEMKMINCHNCGKELGRGGLKYVVEVKSFADFDGYLEEYDGDLEEGINELLDAMEHMDTALLEDDVYMEHSYLLCKACRDRFASDPFRKAEPKPEREEHKGTIH